MTIEEHLLNNRRISTEHFYNGTPCWEYTGGHDSFGYGYYSSERTNVHRVAARLWIGSFDPKLHVLHHCDNPPCFNPEHLFQGTPAQNAHDMCKKGRHRNSIKTHCKWGHPLTEENTYPNGSGRGCKACRTRRNNNRWKR